MHASFALTSNLSLLQPMSLHTFTFPVLTYLSTGTQRQMSLWYSAVHWDETTTDRERIGNSMIKVAF